MASGLADAAREFLAVYGERGYLVLRAIRDAARLTPGGRVRLGDFDYKSVKRRLKELGVDYNPSLLLARLEKEYGLIETTYKSGSQHWWRILDPRALEEAIAEYEGREPGGGGDPRLRLLRIQFYALQPDRLLEELRRLPARPRRGSREEDELRRIALRDLPLLVEFLERARSEYPDELSAEIDLAERILAEAESKVAPAGAGLQYQAPLYRVREPVKDGFEG
ncbi:hypothetical protein [Stetteria hydrogenophila]